MVSMSSANIANALTVALAPIVGPGHDYQKIAEGANQAMVSAGIKTREGAAAFLATCCVESDYFRTTTEYTSQYTKQYDPYRGRGFIQITLRGNYVALGEWAYAKKIIDRADLFVSAPTKLAEPQYAWLGASWYFTKNFSYRGRSLPLSEIANLGDIRAVSGAVNRGNTELIALGMSAREKVYQTLLATDLAAPTAPVRVKQTRLMRLQSALALTPDGVWGKKTERQALAIRRALRPHTRASRWDMLRLWRLRRKYGPKAKTDFVIRAIQRAVGVTPDGVWGKGTDGAFLRVRADAKASGRFQV